MGLKNKRQDKVGPAVDSAAIDTTSPPTTTEADRVATETTRSEDVTRSESRREDSASARIITQTIEVPFDNTNTLGAVGQGVQTPFVFPSSLTRSLDAEQTADVVDYVVVSTNAASERTTLATVTIAVNAAFASIVPTSTSPSSTTDPLTQTASAATSSASAAKSGSKSNIGAIAGGVVGGVVVIILILALLIFCLLKKRRRRNAVPKFDTHSGSERALHPGNDDINSAPVMSQKPIADSQIGTGANNNQLGRKEVPKQSAAVPTTSQEAHHTTATNANRNLETGDLDIDDITEEKNTGKGHDKIELDDI